MLTPMSLPLRSCFYFIIVGLALCAGPARAQTRFSVVEPGVQHIFTDDNEPGVLNLHIKNNTKSRITLRADLNGSSNFALVTDNFVFSIPPDSSDFTVQVYFRPIPGDTSQTFLTLRDFGTFESQTVEIWGFDLRTPSPENAWSASQDMNFGSYYTGTEVADAITIVVFSHSDDTIAVTASILDGSYGISLNSPATVRIAPNEVSNHDFLFDSQHHDSAYAQVLISGEGKFDTVNLFARAIGDTMYWHAQRNFYDVPAGDTMCKTVRIYNRMSPNTGYITELVMRGSNPGNFFVHDAPALPAAIAPGDSLEITVCYIGPTDHEWSEARLAVTYDFPDQIERSHVILLYGCIECSITLRDPVLTYDSLTIGIPSIKSVWLDNPQGVYTTIDSISFGGDKRFSTSTGFPQYIKPNSSASLDVAFTATPEKIEAGDLAIYTSCGTWMVDLVVPDIDVDPSWIPLYGDQVRSLTFSGDTGTRSVTYRFFNDQTDSLSILSVSLSQGSLFSITSIAPSIPAFKLGPYGLMDVTVRFDGTPGSYSDTLIIVTATGVVALHFPIDAVIMGGSVHHSSNADVKIGVMPNPSSGHVSIQIEGGTISSFEVSDLLGRVMYRSNDPAQSHWDGAGVASGTYLMRITGVDEFGDPFTATRQVVIE